MGIHDGHRERLRERFTEHGLDIFNDVNALELLLFYSIPRKDTNEVAHRLLEHFGSLYEVFSASVEDLCQIQGISHNSAVFITMIPQIMRKAEISKTKDVKTIEGIKEAKEFVIPRFKHRTEELLLMICIDGARKILCCKEIARGSVDGMTVNIRSLVEIAIKYKATSVIIAHNHPNGILRPSIEDDHTTNQLYKALAAVGIKLEDHLIVAGDNCISTAGLGMMNLYKF